VSGINNVSAAFEVI